MALAETLRPTARKMSAVAAAALISVYAQADDGVEVDGTLAHVTDFADDVPVVMAPEQDNALQDAFEAVREGKPVTLRIGRGISPTLAAWVKETAEDDGCSVTMTEEGGFPMRFTVEVDGAKERFKDSGSAGSFMKKSCKEGGPGFVSLSDNDGVAEYAIPDDPGLMDDAFLDEPLEAWEMAADFADNNKALGFALYAPKNDPNIPEIMAAIEGYADRKGVEAETFVGESPAGYSLTVYIKGVQLDTTPVDDKATKRISQAIELLPGAWEPPVDFSVLPPEVSKEPQRLPVILRAHPLASELDQDALVLAAEEARCPVTLTQDGPSFGAITVEVGEDSADFFDSGSAGSYMLRNCLAEEKGEGVPEEPVEQLEAWEMATDFADNNRAVGIAIYGPKDDPNLETAKAAYEGWFNKNNIRAKAFMGVGTGEGYGVTFYIKGLQFGATPMNEKAFPNMQLAAQLLPGAWEPPVAFSNMAPEISKEPQGLPVVLRAHELASKLGTEFLVETAEEAGCPVTLTDDGEAFAAITVEVGEKSFDFIDSGSAGAFMIDLCAPSPQEDNGVPE